MCGNYPTNIILLLILVSGGGLGISGQPLSCHRECSKFGNCNQETEECECPFGRTGKACGTDQLRACRLTPTAPAYCDDAALQSCECLSQCYEYLCTSSFGCNTFIDLGPHRVCYSRAKKPGLSNKIKTGVPYENETSISYYRGYLPDARTKISYDEATVRNFEKSLPLDECPERCNGRGACMQWTEHGEGLPECRCYHGFEGVVACEGEFNVCTNKCSGRGKCIDSFCHCDPPYWGIGCGRSKAYPTQNTSLSNPTNFKIYMYDLPSHVAYQQAYFAGWQGHDPIYIAYQLFLDSLIKSNVRTEDPSEAHLFFLPALTYAYTSNLGHPDFHITRVINYVREEFPYWNRSSGRDHIVWTPGDRSSCLLNSPEAKSLIKLTHFGYFDRTAAGKFPMVLHVPNEEWGCYHPLRDVAMPPLLSHGGLVAKETFIDRVKSADNPLPLRKELFFFAGGFRPDDLEYSGGTRHLIADFVSKWNDTDFIIVEGSIIDYEETLRKTKFCLAPYGHGWGIRIVSIMVTGCIPVIVQEHVFQPYEDILPYEEFSIRLNNDDIPMLPSILRSISPQQLAALQAGVAKYWPAFIWHSEYGGKAFEYAMLALRRRHVNLKSKYYGRHSADLFRKLS